jgi:hypothetical protein
VGVLPVVAQGRWLARLRTGIVIIYWISLSFFLSKAG